MSKKIVRHLNLVLIALFLFLTVGCGQEPGMATIVSVTTTPAFTDLTYVVQRGTVTRVLEFAGRIEPIDEVALYFRTSGYVKVVYVNAGDPVRAGDLLAELEAELGVASLQDQIASAELNLAVAQAQLEQAEQANAYAITQAELTLLRAQQELSRTGILGADYLANSTRARVELERAEAAIERARIEYQEALDRPWATPEEVDGYAFALQMAEWNLETARSSYQQALAAEKGHRNALTIAEIAVRQAETELTQLKQASDSVLTLEVQRAQQVLDWLRQGSQIVAPVDGVVVSLSLYPGRIVEPFQPVVVVADPDAIEVSASLSAEQLTEVTEGQQATIMLSVNPEQSWPGTIRSLPYPYGTGGRFEDSLDIDNSTRISVDANFGELKLGALVQVSVVLEEKDDVLWLPPAVIRTFQGRTFVIVQDGERQRRVDVKLGLEAQDRVEILEGLEEGAAVVAQ